MIVVPLLLLIPLGPGRCVCHWEWCWLVGLGCSVQFKILFCDDAPTGVFLFLEDLTSSKNFCLTKVRLRTFTVRHLSPTQDLQGLHQQQLRPGDEVEHRQWLELYIDRKTPSLASIPGFPGLQLTCKERWERFNLLNVTGRSP